MNRRRTNRREFLKISAMTAAGVVISSCAKATTQAPATPAGETAVPPTATTVATALPTSTMAATTVPTATKAAAKTAEELLKAANLPLPGAPNDPKGWKDIIPAIPDGMPLDPPVKMTGALTLGQFKFLEGDDINNNPWSRMIKAVLGIQLEAKFTAASGDDMSQKINLAIASGDIPDQMIVDMGVFKQLVDADLIQDLTDDYEKYASEQYLKKPLSYGGGEGWNYCTVNGRKYGIPRCNQAAQDDKLLWIRQDWLDKLSLKAPTTLDELAEVALAFKKANLGAGAAGTTIGLLATSSISDDWFGSLDPVWGAFGTMPGRWTLQNGVLGNDVIRPETKECLALLAKWYKDGVLASDFYTHDATAAEGLVAGNQCGLHFTPYWTPIWGIKESADNDKNAVWTFNDICAGPTGIKKKAWTSPYQGGNWVISKNFKNIPEYFNYLNWQFELQENPATRYFRYTSIEGVDFTIEDGVLKTNGMDIMKWSDHFMNFCNPEQFLLQTKWIEANWSTIAKTDRDAQMNYYLNLDTMQTLYNDAFVWVMENSEAQGIKEMFTSPPTQTMIDKGVDLGTRNSDIGTLATKTFIDIITGQKPVSAFDDFVKQWKSLGGDQITKEVNDWWSTLKK